MTISSNSPNLDSPKANSWRGSDPITIAVDAMGSDAHPSVEINASFDALSNRSDTDQPICIKLIGDQHILGPLVDKEKRTREQNHSLDPSKSALDIVHASDVILMTDNPSTAAKRKVDASMNVAMSLVKEGQADAMISAGNSGAIMACALFKLKRLKGVERPALLTLLPSSQGKVALLDSGANNESKASHLVQFAALGAAYAHEVLDRSHPTVGLIANGSEKNKGTETTRSAHQTLSELSMASNAPYSFSGYIEGREIFEGDTHVVVCDGYTGNLILKVAEGAVSLVGRMIKQEVHRNPLTKASGLGLKKGLGRIKQNLSYEEIGGAPLLGVNGNVFVCHGSSNCQAIVSAIENACQMVRSDFIKKLPGYIRKS